VSERPRADLASPFLPPRTNPLLPRLPRQLHHSSLTLLASPTALTPRLLQLDLAGLAATPPSARRTTRSPTRSCAHPRRQQKQLQQRTATIRTHWEGGGRRGSSRTKMLSGPGGASFFSLSSLAGHRRSFSALTLATSSPLCVHRETSVAAVVARTAASPSSSAPTSPSSTRPPPPILPPAAPTATAALSRECDADGSLPIGSNPPSRASSPAPHERGGQGARPRP